MRGAIDFAGTFPPALQPESAALETYLRTRESGEQWVLGRFVCSTKKLTELAAELEKWPNAAYLPVAAIGRASWDRGSWEDALTQDAEAVNAFHRLVGERSQIEAYEILIPPEGNRWLYINDLMGFREAELFAEISLSEEFEETLADFAETEWLGAKVRCGGEAMPDARRLAGFVRGCIDLDLPFKLTAGLHHPLAAADGSSHGFLNVLGATALGLGEDLSRREIEKILADPDADAWRFDDEGVAWRDRRADLDAIDESRDLFTAFGSCSIDEPVGGIRERW